MPYVNLPPGNVQLKFADGGPVARRENGRAWVSDERARMINSMTGNGEGGLLNATSREYGVTPGAGRVCTGCGRRWYKWTKVCHFCKADTAEE